MRAIHVAESGADGYVPKPVVDHGAFMEQLRVFIEEAA